MFAFCLLLIAPPPDASCLACDLVGQLAAPSFRQREAAAQSLLEMGMAGKPAVQDGLKHADPEVRERCRKLLPALIERGLPIELARLEKDADLREKHDLPGWERFARTVGSKPECRDFYIRMIRKAPAASALLEIDPAGLVRLYRERLFQIADEKEKVDNPDDPLNEQFRYSHDISEIAFWLFAFQDKANREEVTEEEAGILRQDRQWTRAMEDVKMRGILEKIK